MTIKKFLAYHESDNVEEITMIFLKLEEKELWQRFFLDASFGFWEEWDEEGSFDGFEDDPFIDLSEKYKLSGSKVFDIVCSGSYDELSSLYFKLGEIELGLKYRDESDYESCTVLKRL